MGIGEDVIIGAVVVAGTCVLVGPGRVSRVVVAAGPALNAPQAARTMAAKMDDKKSFMKICTSDT